MIEARLEGAGRVIASGPAATEARLERAAHQFEAMMMKELLEPLRRSNALTDENEGDTGLLGEYASESLAVAMSAGGGFGMAERIAHSLFCSGKSSRTPEENGGAVRIPG